MKNSVKIIALIVLSVLISPLAFAGLPDLAISKVEVNNKCKLDISVKNYGDDWPAQNFTFYIRIQAVKDGKGAGGASQPIIQAADLGPAGGEITFHFFPITINGETEVRIDVDQSRKIVESNENNNHVVRTVTCGPAQTQPTINIKPITKTAPINPKLLQRKDTRKCRTCK